MKLELTHACSLNDFLLVMGIYRGHSFVFLECIYLSLLYPSFYLICFCRCVCVWVYVLEWFWISLTVIFPLCVWESVLRISYGYMCGLKFTSNFIPNSFCQCIDIRISIYLLICICFQLDAFVREHVWYKV